MKKIYIVAALVLVAGIVMLINVSADFTTYANFQDAIKNGDKVKIAGKLRKDQPMIYNPIQDPNQFSFTMEDIQGKACQVTLLKSKPQDFEVSEQIVVTGKMQGSVFYATDILLKCPSKYKNEEIFIKKSS